VFSAPPASPSDATPPVAVLIATCDRPDLLSQRSLPSVQRQTRRPDFLVVVDDSDPAVRLANQTTVRELPFDRTLVAYITNTRARGAAGAWNTGLEWLTTHAGNSSDLFVAILDDDDEWDPNHLSANLATAQQAGASVVISGLRLLRDGILCERSLPQGFTPDMFLTGNPGWQGSNTFASLRALGMVGGFRDGLASCNDRDLAIRLLRCPGVQTADTAQWTATWHLSTTRNSLSSPRSEAKLRGLRSFWQLYGSEMDAAQTEQFFQRALHYFHIERIEILEGTSSAPSLCAYPGGIWT
jgi:glycosyltransferase involved in cell wall biosynthesis